MAEAVIYDKRRILPIWVKLEGEYGVHGLFVGVPAIVGANGVEKVVELDSTPLLSSAGQGRAQRFEPQDCRQA
jgi:malate dehydrogenase